MTLVSVIYFAHERKTVSNDYAPELLTRIFQSPTNGFNKGRSSKFREGSQVRQTPEEGRWMYRPKRCGNNNKNEDNSPKTLNDKNQQASSQKFRQRKMINIKKPFLNFITSKSFCFIYSGSVPNPF